MSKAEVEQRESDVKARIAALTSDSEEREALLDFLEDPAVASNMGRPSPAGLPWTDEEVADALVTVREAAEE